MMKAVFQTMHPLMRALMYFCILMVCATIGLGIGIAVSSSVTGIDLESLADTSALMHMDGGITALKIMNSANQLIGFLGSALLFSLFFGKLSVDGFWTKKWSKMIGFLPLLIFFALPLLLVSFEFNSMLIPEGGYLESLFKPSEELAGEMTETMLTMNTPLDLVLMLIVVAVLPGICEEFAFRGVLQSQLAKGFKNVHLGIWVSAFIFSAIHFQFYGFIPRMLLGAFFGYLVIHTGSIWTAVVAHTLNNGYAVVSAYMAGQMPDMSTEDLDNASLNPYFVLISAILFSLLFWVILQKSTWKNIQETYLNYLTLPVALSQMETLDTQSSEDKK